eukprot:4211622-Amphidinium_carterae.1
MSPRLKVPFIVSALATERICVSNASQCFFMCAISRPLAANSWSYLFLRFTAVWMSLDATSSCLGTCAGCFQRPFKLFPCNFLFLHDLLSLRELCLAVLLKLVAIACGALHYVASRPSPSPSSAGVYLLRLFQLWRPASSGNPQAHSLAAADAAVLPCATWCAPG